MRVRWDGGFNYSPIRVTPAPIAHWYWVIGWDVFILASSLFCLLDLTPYFFSQNMWILKIVFFNPHKIFFLTSHFISSSRDGWSLALESLPTKISFTHYGLARFSWHFVWFQELWKVVGQNNCITLKAHGFSLFFYFYISPQNIGSRFKLIFIGILSHHTCKQYSASCSKKILIIIFYYK